MCLLQTKPIPQAAARTDNIARGYGGHNGFRGLVDEIRIYNRSLNSTEILELYRGGLSDTNRLAPLGTCVSIGATDTCTYGGSGNWVVSANDNCNISSAVAGDGSNLTIQGTGKFTITANISGFANYIIQGNDSSNICEVTCQGGCFV